MNSYANVSYIFTYLFYLQSYKIKSILYIAPSAYAIYTVLVMCLKYLIFFKFSLLKTYITKIKLKNLLVSNMFDSDFSTYHLNR